MAEEFPDHDEFTVDSTGNVVFFYGDVSQKSVARLAKVLREVAHSVSSQYKGSVIYLFVHSGGGDVYAGLGAMDHVSTLDVPVFTVVDGMVGSAATFITLAGKKRFIMPSAHMHIHQLSTYFGGKFEDMKDDYKQSKKLMKMIRKIYLSKSNLNETELDKMLNRETTLSAAKAIRLGFADEIYA
jgi:ATP-dependent Clp protease, protease subunit